MATMTRQALLAKLKQDHPAAEAEAMFNAALARSGQKNKPLYTLDEAMAISYAVVEDGLAELDAAAQELAAWEAAQ